MISIYSSKVILNMSTTLISMIHNLTHNMSLSLLLKTLLLVMDLNMAYKMSKTSKNTRNIDFRKNHEKRFSCYISRSSAPYAPFFPLAYLTLSNYPIKTCSSNKKKPNLSCKMKGVTSGCARKPYLRCTFLFFAF